MSWNSSNVIPKIKVENAIQELLNKFNNLSLRDPKNHILFKNLFSQDCNKNKTISLLNSIISNDETPENKNESPEISKIELHVSKYAENERPSIVDVHAKDNKNNVDYLIEMQVLKDINMLNRTEYNSSKIFQTFFENGKPYNTNRKVYSINILYFNLFHPSDKNYKKYFHTLYTHEPGRY